MARTKLHSLFESSLSPTALSYGLNLSVLIKGASGSGKSCLVQSVARDLGFHLVQACDLLEPSDRQAECFAVVGDTDAVTEGTLQAIAEKAVACAPSVLFLKHIEALARKSESLASGQGDTLRRMRLTNRTRHCSWSASCASIDSGRNEAD